MAHTNNNIIHNACNILWVQQMISLKVLATEQKKKRGVIPPGLTRFKNH